MGSACAPERVRRVPSRKDGLRSAECQVWQRGARLDSSGLGEVDPLIGEGDLELAIAGEHERNPDLEDAPLAELALQVDVATEQLGQLADDREAEPGPLVLAGQDGLALAGGLGLAELLEDRLAIVFGDADAGVLDLDEDESALGAGPEGHTSPLRGELDGVGQQVVEDLSQLARVLSQERDRLVDPVLQRDVLPLGDRPRQVGQSLADIPDREVLGADLHLSALDLGQVEDIVDHRQQHLARGLDVSGISSVPLVELVGAGKDLGEADDRVERRTQFVAHRRQEVALEPVHLEEREVGLRQLIDLAVQVVVHLSEFLLHGDEVVDHPIECVGKLLEFVAGLDLAANRQSARRDRVGDVAEVLDRLDDHVADDHGRREHRQDRRDHRGGDQDGPVAVDRLVGLLHGEVDDHGAGQVAGFGLDPKLAVGAGPPDVVVDLSSVFAVTSHQAARIRRKQPECTGTPSCRS